MRNRIIKKYEEYCTKQKSTAWSTIKIKLSLFGMKSIENGEYQFSRNERCFHCNQKMQKLKNKAKGRVQDPDPAQTVMQYWGHVHPSNMYVCVHCDIIMTHTKTCQPCTM